MNTNAAINIRSSVWEVPPAAESFTFVSTQTLQNAFPTPPQEPEALAYKTKRQTILAPTKAALVSYLEKVTKQKRLRAYAASFIGTPQEFDQEFEKIGVDVWPKQSSKRKRKSGKR